MKRQNTCAGIFRNRNGRVPVIGKVIRGRNVRRLLYYLYGPGLANEHADPHLVAGFSDPADRPTCRRLSRRRAPRWRVSATRNRGEVPAGGALLRMPAKTSRRV